MLCAVAQRGTHDDLRTVEVPVQPPSAEEFAEAPRTVIDDARAFEAPTGEASIEASIEASLDASTEAPTGEASLDASTDASTDPAAADAVPADAIHILPTQQISAPPRRASTSLSKLSASATTTSSPVEAMKLDEVARTRVFLHFALAICAGGIIVALSTGGDHIAKVVVIAGSLAAVVGAVAAFALTRDPASYEPTQLVVPALLIVFGSMSGVYYWGAGSPVAAMLVYGIYFFSLGADRRVTTAMYALVAVTHGVLGAGIMTGVLADHGVVQIGQLRTREQLAILCIIEALYFVAYYTARVSQRVTLDAMGKLEQAVRGNAQRDALLAEARAELDRALKIGGPGRFTDQVVGSFRLGMLIGRGGIGEVYEAHAVTDRREAAVKLLHPGTLAEPIQVQRFLREAQIASRLDCPHVVRVLEVGTTAGEIPFLAMERLRGFDLAHQLRRQRRLPLPPTKVLADQLAIGLEAARVAGIVHRDLKPHNVFFAEEGGLRRWKILDFGVSKAGGSRHPHPRPRRRHTGVHGARSRRGARTSTTARTSTRSPPSCSARSPATRCSPARMFHRPCTRSSTACRPGRRCSPSCRPTSIASSPSGWPRIRASASGSRWSSRAGSRPP